eukprot:CAMPEP_0204843876 /NCGR_PEP_ID=MMETSP1346-20131115/48237_1 /ASSEMBLY_ACC=CAM_ASM_000771 /TAXON_ID=215587 /ORGANISM="Aplanochytrium stocchinoi, Strain GSBS06" /LENGTH=524 /DNA_ID=CAMNT_0051983097 /DNA_START=178 /DNA_END=1752 /DNA_ORIENTATION=+
MIKVPFECMNLEFRDCQKTVEKALTNTINVSSGLSSRLSEKAGTKSKKVTAEENELGSVNWDKVVDNLDKVVALLKDTRNKVLETHKQQQHLVQRCKKRMRFIRDRDRELETSALIADHLLRQGYPSSANMLAEKENISDIVDNVVFNNVYHISKQLRDGNIDPALQWCEQRKSRLKRMQSSLEFELRRIAFLQLVCQEKHEEAVYYAQKYLAPHKNEQFETIKKTMATLVLSKQYRNKKQNREEVPPVDIQRKGREAKSDHMDIDEDEIGRAKFKRAHSRSRSLKRKRGMVEKGKERPNVETTSLQDEILPKELWDKIVAHFEMESNKMLSLSQQSSLQIFVQVGLSALKTRKCKCVESENKGNSCGSNIKGESKEGAFGNEETKMKQESGAKKVDDKQPNQKDEIDKTEQKVYIQKEETKTRKNSCPACHPAYHDLAKSLPFAHTGQSQLVCRISGALMDENNPPMAFPNGQVYSLKALEGLAMKSLNNLTQFGNIPGSTMVKCPVTNEECSLDELTKVFVL